MAARSQPLEASLLVSSGPAMLSLQLNRPKALNCLDPDLVSRLHEALSRAAETDTCRYVLLSGSGDRGFCAGGDIKYMAAALRQGEKAQVLEFLEAEYELDLLVRRFPKPVVVLADGICLGGGLGLAAGADFVLVSERTRMAMPESRIGFFPDVGATGWLFEKCPPGYPEFLGLTGYGAEGGECVRLGLASQLVPMERLGRLIRRLQGIGADELPGETGETRAFLAREIVAEAVPPRREAWTMDSWVQEVFAGRESLLEIRDSLLSCSREEGLCRFVFSEFDERSPTAMALTLRLLRQNEHRRLEEVLASDLKAASFMLDHPDFLEGVRARLEDRDDRPAWSPSRLEEVDLSGFQ